MKGRRKQDKEEMEIIIEEERERERERAWVLKSKRVKVVRKEQGEAVKTEEQQS